jgi:hypothetical protein
VRLVSAGIPRVIAQRWLATAALALVACLIAAAPSFAADLVPGVPDPAAVAAPALPPAAAQPVQQAVDTVRPATQPVQHHVAAVQQRVQANGPPPAPARRAVEALAPQAAATAADPAGPARSAGPPAGEVTKRLPLQPPTVGDPGQPVDLDGVVRLLGDTLRALAPVDALVKPVGPLLAGLHALTAPLDGLHRGDQLAPRSAGGGGMLGATSPQLQAAPRQPAAPAALPSFQSASAQPPAAEAGGRPESPSPRKAPAPAAGGAATSAPAGVLFVPFLALLVLAALAAPMLMRRLDAAKALMRPTLFVCALERPG